MESHTVAVLKPLQARCVQSKVQSKTAVDVSSSPKCCIVPGWNDKVSTVFQARLYLSIPHAIFQNKKVKSIIDDYLMEIGKVGKNCPYWASQLYIISFFQNNICLFNAFNAWTDSGLQGGTMIQLPSSVCLQVHYILQEVVMGGMVLETNMNEIVAQVEVQNRMEKSEVSLLVTLKDLANV